MKNDGSRAGGALGKRLPVALAEDLAGNLRAARWGDLDELDVGRREHVRPGKEVAYDGLEMAVHQPPTGVKPRAASRPCIVRRGLRSDSRRSGHARAPQLVLAAV